MDGLYGHACARRATGKRAVRLIVGALFGAKASCLHFE
jgi:hypothetical protein